MGSRFVMIVCWLAVSASDGRAAVKIFASEAVGVEAEGGIAGEGPAWHPQLGVLTSGNGHICQLDRNGKSKIYRTGADTNGLLFDATGRLLACEPKLRRVTRTELSPA